MSRKNSNSSEETDPDLIDHIQGLGLETVGEYRDWCARNGFSRKLRKHWKLRCRERFHARGGIARARLGQKKREQRNPIRVLTELCEGRVDDSELTQPHLQRLSQTLRTNDTGRHANPVDCEAILRLLKHLHHRRAKFFDGAPVIADLGESPGNTFVEALALIAGHSRAWLRPAEDWKPRSHNARRQFASLLRHLFVRYDGVPAFLDAVWFAGRTKEATRRREWYLHVGRGENIRHCRLPIPFTKRMAHHFMQAPGDVTVEQALRWGQVRGLGGDERLARALFGTRLAACFTHDAFWTSLIRWFVAHPMFDRAHVGPVIDYLHHQRFVPQRDLLAPGRRDEAPPPQPNLSMNGRTPEALLRQVNAWHRALSSDNTHQVQQWKSCGVNDFEFLEGSQENGTWKCWTIRELLSSRALLAEGRQLKHCVATYASSCAHGHSSIWTMEVESFQGRAKAMTIEVRNGRQICQARGKANRLPTEKERGLLRRWATKEGLSIASYV